MPGPRSTTQMQGTSRPPARAARPRRSTTRPSTPALGPVPEREYPRSRTHVTITRHSRFSWCGFIATTVAVIGAALGIRWLAQGPRRAEIVHTETRGRWTGRITRIGSYDENTQTWVGRSKFEIELQDPERSVHRITAFHPEIDDAIALLRRELDERTDTISAPERGQP